MSNTHDDRNTAIGYPAKTHCAQWETIMNCTNCIMVGVGATEDKLRTKDGEILFASPKESLLFSEGVIYHNGKEIGRDTSMADILKDILLPGRNGERT